MKRVVKVRLVTSPEQFRSLASTLAACNAAANRASVTAHSHGAATGKKLGFRTLQRMAYADMKSTLSAQPSLLALSKVAASYATLRVNLKSNNYGPAGSERRVKVEGTPISFRPDAAQPFDDRCLSWQHDHATLHTGTVSIWTVNGRVKDVGFVGHPAQVALLRRHRKGETDLLIRDGVAYLIATLDIDAPPISDGPHLDSSAGWIGVDLGIANIAVTSDRLLASQLMTDFGENAPDGPSGRGSVKDRRTRNRELREKLQKKGTRSAKRLLRRRRRTESRFAADVNHQISKRIVVEAERTGRGIAIEELTGIRARVRLRKPQRATHSSWAFAQLGALLTYKAEAAGVPIVHVDPANTSRRCTACGHTEKKNRTSQAQFCCTSCGFVEHADLVGADNIALLAPSTYRAQSTVPSAA